jgi:hypothetical protein
MSSAKKFHDEFDRLLIDPKVDIYTTYIACSLEWIAGKLFEGMRDGGIWYDGVSGLVYQKKKSRKIEFSGKMWVMQNQKAHWLEEFNATVTDKTITKQGLLIKVKLGEYVAEGDVYELL